MPVGGALGAAVIGAGANLYGSSKAADASSKASQAALDYQKQIRGDVQPYLTAGTDALGRISNPNALMTNFQASPDYKYRLNQALDAVTTNKAVNGLLRSGSALKAVTGTAGDMASGEFGNWWNRQQGLAGLGVNAEGVAAGVANNSSNIAMTNGANQGNAAIANGNTIGQFGGSIADLIAKYGGSGSKPAPAANASSFSSPWSQSAPGA